MTETDKRTSLIWDRINYGRKSFIKQALTEKEKIDWELKNETKGKKLTGLWYHYIKIEP